MFFIFNYFFNFHATPVKIDSNKILYLILKGFLTHPSAVPLQFYVKVILNNYSPYKLSKINLKLKSVPQRSNNRY